MKDACPRRSLRGRWRSTLLALLLASQLGACAYNHLGGSVDLPLEFDHLRIRKQGSALLIEYLKQQPGGTTEKVVKLVVETEGLALPEADEPLDLEAETFAEHVILQRSTEAADSFPATAEGELHFEVLQFIDRGHIDGEFVITFDNQRNLEGWFDGNLEEI